MECNSRSLATQNCHIQWSDHKVHIRGDKVNSFNGVHRSIVDLPVAGEKVEWQRIRLRRMSGQLYLEAEIWGAPDESTNVSALNWVIYKFNKVNPVLKLNKKIQRRKPKSAEKAKTSFELMDKPIKYKLFVKSKKVYWKHGFDEGVIQ